MVKISNEEYNEWANQLFEDVDDCSVCPFSEQEGNADIFRVSSPCYGHPDYYMPCQWKEKFVGMTNQEVVDYEEERYRRRQKSYLEMEKRKQEQELKKKERIEKARKTKSENYVINRDINFYRDRIKKRTAYIERLKMFIDTTNAVNDLMKQSYEHLDTDAMRIVIKYEKDNESDINQLNLLLKQRAEKNKERRKKG